MNSVFIAVASLIWAFNLEHAHEDSGEEIPIDDKAYIDSLIMLVLSLVDIASF